MPGFILLEHRMAACLLAGSYSLVSCGSTTVGFPSYGSLYHCRAS